MPGQLFTHYFLEEGIRLTEAWQELPRQPPQSSDFGAAVAALFERMYSYQNPNEAVTELDLIRPLLELLGWADYLPQQGNELNEDIPDHLLFADAEAKSRAATKAGAARYSDALVVAESKRFGLSLDARDKTDSGQASSPHGQILRYLATADISSDGRVRWGILTNGPLWRLYDRRARPRASGYYEADLGALLAADDQDGLRIFRLLFGRAAFIRRGGAQTTFLEDALAEGRRNEEQVAQDLSGVVFERVYPALIEALAQNSEADLGDVRQAALIFLYRLLFLLYAEDRDLLPVNDGRYDDYGLRRRVRVDIARRMADGDTFSAIATNYYDHIMTLCRLLDKGDGSIGLPPYNGGLFAQTAAPLLDQVRLPDNALAPVIYDLSHTETGAGRRYVNYRDMTVQQLGSIYERLLEREPTRDADGAIVVRPNSYARKDSGSFYTPQTLVDLIVDRTLKPLVEERVAAFEAKAAALQSDSRAKAVRAAELRKLDPAEAVLDLKVLDPAMGSGHFLVTAVDYLSDTIADLAEYPPALPAWLDGDYSSPLLARVAAVRQEILQRARASDWVINQAQLTDQAIIRRMVLKRCIYGVDKNPLTVELAKVSLWLHSFTVGAPLSFLNHHLRCGDSLIGLRVHDATGEMQRLGKMYSPSAIQAAENATTGMQRIEEMSDADIAEVEESATLFREVERTTAELRSLLDTLCGVNWLAAGMKKKARADFEIPAGGGLRIARRKGLCATDRRSRQRRCRGRHPEALLLACVQRDVEPGEGDRRPRRLSALGGRLSGRMATLAGRPAGGRLRRGDRQPALGPDQAARGGMVRHPFAGTGAGSDRGRPAQRGIQRLRDGGAPLATEFDDAKQRADGLGQLIRVSGHYPLLGGGDINLYSLFVERAMHLIKPGGIVGLLTPSGIYADKTAARFFKSVSTSGRVGGLFDFENRRPGTGLPHFFKDVRRLASNSAPLYSAGKSESSTRPNAPSSCTIPTPSRTRNVASRWPRPTSPA